MKRILLPSLLASAIIGLVSSKGTAEDRSPPGTGLDTNLVVGDVSILYAVDNQMQFFFTVRPEGQIAPGWLQINVDKGPHLLKLVQESAKNDWTIGVYYDKQNMVTAVFTESPGAEGGTPSLPGRHVQPLDVAQLTRTEESEPSVGGTSAIEGYVTPYGAFRLGGGKHEGMLMASGQFPNPVFFNHGPIIYIREHVDPSTGTEGSLYKSTLDDSSVRFFLFGNDNIGSCGEFFLRRVICYDGSGNVKQVVDASYAPGFQPR